MKHNFNKISFPLLVIALIYAKDKQESFLGVLIALELISQVAMSLVENFKKEKK